MVSAPKFEMNMLFQEASFRLGDLVVDGTFMTELYVQCDRARAAHSAPNATELNYGWHAVWITCADGKKRWVFPHQKLSCPESNLTVSVEYATATVMCGTWVAKSSVRRVFDRISGAARRIDFTVHGIDVAHGVVGQNLHAPRQGRLDKYPARGRYQTVAQAEGAIDGSFLDYRVRSPFDTEFRYSLFRNASHSGSRRAAAEGGDLS
tara:strand:- start:1588 stop:2208 length:621 start_codon:yes stop_codon:yes gene_type:complete